MIILPVIFMINRFIICSIKCWKTVKNGCKTQQIFIFEKLKPVNLTLSFQNYLNDASIKNTVTNLTVFLEQWIDCSMVDSCCGSISNHFLLLISSDEDESCSVLPAAQTLNATEIEVVLVYQRSRNSAFSLLNKIIFILQNNSSLNWLKFWICSVSGTTNCFVVLKFPHV